MLICVFELSEIGCALTLELSTHSRRIYSVDVVFDNMPEAKLACAKVALDSDLLDFIKYGNGQKAPPIDAATKMKDDVPLIVTTPNSSKSPMTLQSFYDTLPKPFPEPVGEKSATDINAQGWLNTLVQLAKGTKLITSFNWIADPKQGCM